ncbi:MAG TPA: hypothetical protein VGN69_07510 [Solirubrobacteraceae bacterium]|jgi:hypothetical protein|nr:hypothetical protein [Solirubrobacteraceae bacterium]
MSKLPFVYRDGPVPAPRPLTLAPDFHAPIFHDGSGRRARLVRAAGVFAVLLGLAWVAILTAGSTGFAHLPALQARNSSSAGASVAAHTHRAHGARVLVAAARLDRADSELAGRLSPASLRTSSPVVD